VCLRAFVKFNFSSSLSAVIRECFPTSILLGSIEAPVEPTEQCSPVPVESDTIKGEQLRIYCLKGQ
jgi:hypothetical protein